MTLFPRRSFLGWTAAIAGCALLTRPALAVPVSGIIHQVVATEEGWELVPPYSADLSALRDIIRRFKAAEAKAAALRAAVE